MACGLRFSLNRKRSKGGGGCAVKLNTFRVASAGHDLVRVHEVVGIEGVLDCAHHADLHRCLVMAAARVVALMFRRLACYSLGGGRA